ncbi:very short patch repair endonuclease [Ravibacter arvi]|uniref:very short patch repair endonuclease n=1 Tax=Ravibacter arvi TaxID=2051041 RepID=UPI0031EA0A6B
MAAVKNRNTKPEVCVRKALFKIGLRYRVNVKKLPGSPDIVLPKYKTAIFVHGCYWHGHKNCKKQIKPNTNKDFWDNKIQKNKSRDKEVQSELSKLNWKVLIVWECELRNSRSFNITIDKIVNEIVSIK